MIAADLKLCREFFIDMQESLESYSSSLTKSCNLQGIENCAGFRPINFLKYAVEVLNTWTKKSSEILLQVS